MTLWSLCLKLCSICLFLVFALALFPDSFLGNSGIASACYVFFAINIFHYILYHNFFLTDVLVL